MTFTITHLVVAAFAALVSKELIAWLRHMWLRHDEDEEARRKSTPKHMRQD